MSMLAETFLARADRAKLLCDAIVTGDEFREFCNAIGIPPMERLKFMQKSGDESVLSALQYWFSRDDRPTVRDLIHALERWGQFAMIARLRLETIVEREGGEEDEEEAGEEMERCVVYRRSPPMAVPNGNKEADETDVLCVVCKERGREVAFIPCGHRCCCSLCSNRIRPKACPLCRQAFSTTLRVFG